MAVDEPTTKLQASTPSPKLLDGGQPEHGISENDPRGGVWGYEVTSR